MLLQLYLLVPNLSVINAVEQEFGQLFNVKNLGWVSIVLITMFGWESIEAKQRSINHRQTCYYNV